MNVRPTSLPEEDEQELICAVKAGDMSAFSRLVEVHYEFVATLAHRVLSTSSDVPDVVQDVFLSVLQNLNKFRGEATLRTWLTRIVINRCRSHERRWLLRQRSYLQWAERRRQEQVSLDDDSSVTEQVQIAVRKLPAKFREVIVLRYFEELSAKEMSHVLGISENTIEVRLSRARHRLRERLTSCFETEGIHERT